MTGLVVVSHSAKAAEGTAEVVTQISDGNACIVPADGDGDGIGTSPDRVREGIEEAGDGDGVVVLVDLGNAVVNMELAIETAVNSEAVITGAPVLEGTLNTAVEVASRKAALDSVVERAEDARGYRKLS